MPGDHQFLDRGYHPHRYWPRSPLGEIGLHRNVLAAQRFLFHIISTTRPLIVPAFRSVNTWLMSSSFDLRICARTLPSPANAIASARSSRPPTIEPRIVIRFMTTSKIGV